jgi:hypothetical protein
MSGSRLVFVPFFIALPFVAGCNPRTDDPNIIASFRKNYHQEPPPVGLAKNDEPILLRRVQRVIDDSG